MIQATPSHAVNSCHHSLVLADHNALHCSLVVAEVDSGKVFLGWAVFQKMSKVAFHAMLGSAEGNCSELSPFSCSLLMFVLCVCARACVFVCLCGFASFMPIALLVFSQETFH